MTTNSLRNKKLRENNDKGIEKLKNPIPIDIKNKEVGTTQMIKEDNKKEKIKEQK